MNHLWTLALLLFAGTAFGAELALGLAAPEVTATGLDNATVFRLSEKRGHVVILNFWATWCAPCKNEMPALQTYFEQHKDQGLEVLAISMDDARELEQVRKLARSYSFAVALKSQASFKGLGRIWRMPSTFVIDRDGLLRKNGHEGDAEITREQLEALVDPLLARP